MTSYTNLDTAENLIKVVLDTNVLVSAIAIGGKPQRIVKMLLKEEIKGVTSAVLLSELQEVLNKKFPLRESDFKLTVSNIEELFEKVHPKKTLRVVRDDDDNRVLEAAVEGKCDYIVTGDRDLLDLKKYKKIKIVKPAEFLKLIEINGR